MKPFIALAACVLGIALLGSQAPRLSEQIHPTQRSDNLDAGEDHAAVSLLGQFRTSLSSWLWERTDIYLHNGVQMRPMTDGEIKSGVAASKSADGLEEGQGNFTETTLVPPVERDFRGVFGDVERVTSAYHDMQHHTHQDPQQTLPLYRLMTWLDPSFQEGWATGASVMALDSKRGGIEKGIAFLRQGLTQNPKAILLWNDMGYLQSVKLHDLPAAISTFEKGREVVVARENWGEKDLESAQNLYRWLTLCYRENGQYGDCVRIAREGLDRFPKDVVLTREATLPPCVSRDFLRALSGPTSQPDAPVEQRH